MKLSELFSTSLALLDVVLLVFRVDKAGGARLTFGLISKPGFVFFCVANVALGGVLVLFCFFVS
jgi:hypothetical protein